MGCLCFADCNGQDAGLGDVPKGMSPGLGIPPITTLNMSSFFALVSQAFLWKEMGVLPQFAVCCVVCLVGRRTELYMLTLYELLFLEGTSVDLRAMEEREDSNKDRLFSFVKHACGRKWDLYCGLHCAAWYARHGDAQNCAC